MRTYNENNESEDSNIVIARFRRQNPVVSQSDSNTSELKPLHRTQSDQFVENTSQTQIPLRKTQSQENIDSSTKDENHAPIIMSKHRDSIDEIPSPVKSSPSHTNRKPPRSPASSPNRSDKTTNDQSCTKTLFTNEPNDTSARTGVMSRLTKSPHRLKRNNVLINALTRNKTPSPTDSDVSH